MTYRTPRHEVRPINMVMADQNMIGQMGQTTTNPHPEVSLPNKTSSKDESVSSCDLVVPDHQDGENRVNLIEQGSSSNHKVDMRHGQYHYEKLFSQVSEWLQAEKSRRTIKSSTQNNFETSEDIDQVNSSNPDTRHGSNSSMLPLERLQQILTDSMISSSNQTHNDSLFKTRRPSNIKARRHTSVRKQHGTHSSSDTEYQDGAVPSCHIFLDDTKTTLYSSENVKSATQIPTQAFSSRAEKEKKAWQIFKADVLKLAHTLKLKAWSRVPLDRAGDLKIERLSGALTNAVYLVSPPLDISSATNRPRKVLLRIYGPQVEHLINRENELSILRRLAQKKIGPRMLGIFSNGRFEEFFNAQTLTAEDLRISDTSTQIAKRMRELHDGIELLEQEREEGPSVWKNWDKWVKRCEEITLCLDAYVKSGNSRKRRLWRSVDFLCGDEWPKFKLAVERYRKWLENYYGKDRIKQKLVFAHNDTQYGNILRLLADTSRDPSLSPVVGANTHKQLIVIDFEYASANLPGLEFANHFTEWCYNYHSPSSSWLCETGKYPSIEEQTRFIRSYVNHRFQLDPLAPSAIKRNVTSDLSKDFTYESDPDRVSNLDLNSRSNDGTHLEAQQETETENRVQELLEDARLWRAANSAQWVSWGIIQAQIPEFDQSDIKNVAFKEEEVTLTDSNDEEDSDSTDERFDYLSYASDRALFFWGDMLVLGIVTKEDLPGQLIDKLKIVDT